LAARPGREEASALDPFPKPLNITGLFRIFADTEPTLEGIQQFANRYGCLGADLRGPFKDQVNYPELSSGERMGEPFEAWVGEIFRMRHAVELWDCLQAGDVKSVSRFIRRREIPDNSELTVHYIGPKIPIGASGATRQESFQIGLITDGSRPDGARHFDHEFFSWAPSATMFGPPRIVFFPLNDELAPGWAALQGIINSMLLKHRVTPNLTWTRHVATQELRVRIVPSSLLSAIWMQFANAVEGGKEYRQCDTCKTWFEVTAHARAGAKFCRNACRFRAYRMRQAKAGEFYSQGVAVDVIAERLNSDVETVKGWLGK
jgi:hypothetical protein